MATSTSIASVGYGQNMKHETHADGNHLRKERTRRQQQRIAEEYWKQKRAEGNGSSESNREADPIETTLFFFFI